MATLEDYFEFTFETFSHRKLRSFLTVLGIFIGIAAVVTLVSLAQGFEQAVNDQFAMMGENKIMILPGSITSAAGLTNILTRELSEKDLEAVKDTPFIEKVGSMSTKFARIKVGEDISYQFVIGVPTDLNILVLFSGVDIENGRYFRSSDKYKVGVGWLYTQEDFVKKPVRIGDKIEVDNYTLEVVGTVSKIGSPEDDAQVYIPLDTIREMFGNSGYMVILAQTSMGADPQVVAEQIKERLRKVNDQKPGEETFDVQTTEDLRRAYTSIIGLVEFVVIGIAAISLIVGGIGIMNSMYTAVLERTRDIGIMKAIGARNSDIMVIFLIESGMFGLVGGMLGVAGGIGLAKLVEFYAVQSGVTLLKVTLQPLVIFGALAFSFIIGVISGAVPARKAASLNPVDALRYE